MEFQPMSPEDLQRTMQVVVSQQAQFEVGLERLSQKTDRMADGLTGIVGHLADHVRTMQDRTDE